MNNNILAAIQQQTPIEAMLVTTDGVTTTIATIDVAEDTAATVEVLVIGYDESNDTASRFGVNYLVRNVGGTVTLDDVEATVGSVVGSFNGSITTATISGTSLQVNVIGSTAVTIHWKAAWRVLSMGLPIVLP